MRCPSLKALPAPPPGRCGWPWTVETPALPDTRADGGACVLTPTCRLKKRLAAARDAFLKELQATTLADCAWPALPRR